MYPSLSALQNSIDGQSLAPVVSVLFPLGGYDCAFSKPVSQDLGALSSRGNLANSGDVSARKITRLVAAG